MSKFEKEQVFKYPKTLIAGYGIVGKHLKEEFKFAETYDPDADMGADYLEPPSDKYDIVFISVPTPDNNGKCDTKYVESVFNQIKADVYVIKSTVPPKTCDELSEKFKVNALFSPEYYGATQFANAGDDFVILGGDDYSYGKVRNLYE